MALYRALDLVNIRDGFTECGPAQAFGLGKQNLDEYVLYELKA